MKYHTVQSIAAELGVTPRRVQQISKEIYGPRHGRLNDLEKREVTEYHRRHGRKWPERVKK